MNIELARYNISSINYSNRGYQSVLNNGDDNRFPDYLDGLYNSSVTHQSIVNDLVDYIYGQGLVAKDASKQEKLESIFYKKRMKTIIRNKLLQSQICIEVIKDRKGRFAKMELFAPKQIRVSGLRYGVPTKFVYRASWDNKNYQQYKDVAYLDALTDEGNSGMFYWYDSGTFEVPYGRPRYISGLNPIELEASIYLMHNHGAQNGMFPSMIIDMVTSGTAESDKAAIDSIVEQMAGSANAGKLGVLTRPAGEGNQTNFITPNLTGLDKIYENQYQTAEIGILKAWQIPSPTLISGLNSKNSGFSNPAEEMEFALKILQKKRIEPEREEILDILRPLFEGFEIGEVDFVGEETTIDQPEETEQEVREEISEELSESNTVLDEFISAAESMEDFIGWQIDSIMDAEDAETELAIVKHAEKNYPVKMAEAASRVSTGRATPNFKSGQDGEKGNVQYAIRYRYGGDSVGDRPFCKKMLSSNKLYRFEDIKRMGEMPVNPGLGIGGADTYPIFEFKGGVNCHHKWERVTFVKQGLEGGIDVNNPNSKQLSETQADNRDMTPVGEAREKQKISETRPIDMPNKGRYSLSALKNLLKGW